MTANIILRKYTDAAACALMLRAATKLSPYGKSFRTVKTLLWGMLAVGAGWLAFSVISVFGVFEEVWVARVDYVLEFISVAYHLFFNYTLFTGIERLAEETEIPVLVSRAKRQRSMTFGFDLIYLLFLGVSVLRVFMVIAVPILSLLWIVITCINASVIYSCYMWICIEGEEEIGRKRSRFAIVNKISDFLDRFEDKIAQKRGEEENEKLRRKIDASKNKKRK